MDVTARLDRLEKHNRWLRVGIVLSLLGSCGVLLLGAARDEKNLVVESLHLVDRRGGVRGQLGIDARDGLAHFRLFGVPLSHGDPMPGVFMDTSPNTARIRCQQSKDGASATAFTSSNDEAKFLLCDKTGDTIWIAPEK
jgi:hypothetical protein